MQHCDPFTRTFFRSWSRFGSVTRHKFMKYYPKYYVDSTSFLACLLHVSPRAVMLSLNTNYVGGIWQQISRWTQIECEILRWKIASRGYYLKPVKEKHFLIPSYANALAFAYILDVKGLDTWKHRSSQHFLLCQMGCCGVKAVKNTYQSRKGAKTGNF